MKGGKGIANILVLNLVIRDNNTFKRTELKEGQKGEFKKVNPDLIILISQV